MLSSALWLHSADDSITVKIFLPYKYSLFL